MCFLTSYWSSYVLFFKQKTAYETLISDWSSDVCSSDLLKVERTAICGSDLHLYHGPMTIPGVHLGHEFVGTVEDVGAGVRTVAKGDRVLVSGVIGCGHCPECRAGDIVVCRNAGTKV